MIRAQGQRLLAAFDELEENAWLEGHEAGWEIEQAPAGPGLAQDLGESMDPVGLGWTIVEQVPRKGKIEDRNERQQQQRRTYTTSSFSSFSKPKVERGSSTLGGSGTLSLVSFFSSF